MSAKAKFTQADITRAIQGAQRAGLVVTQVEISPDGVISVITAHGSPKVKSPKGEDDWRSRQPGLRENPLDRLLR